MSGTQPKPMRVGFAGTGRMAVAHAQNLSRIPGVQLSGVVSARDERAADFARTWGGRPFASFSEMVESGSLDAVFICTPARLHAEQAAAAARAGLAIFLEKPVSWELPEALRLEQEIERAGVLCQVGYQLRYQASVERAREILAGQSVALVRHHRYWTIPLVQSIRDRKTGGGQVFDQVTHEIDLARYLVGEIETVRAEYTLNARRGEFENWDAYAVLVRFRGGAVGTFASTYALFAELGEPSTLDIVIREKLLRLTPTALTVRSPAGLETVEGAPLEDAQQAFVTAWREGDARRLKSPLADAIRTLAVTLAANRAAETGETIELDKWMEEARRDAGLSGA